jgi:hypothetical protein
MYISNNIHVVYLVSHAIECYVQLVLNNYINLQLHVLLVINFSYKQKLQNLIFLLMTLVESDEPFSTIG